MEATITKPRIGVGELAELFMRADAAAIKADPGDGLHNDGGSCNFDTPTFRIDGMQEVTIKRAAALAGLQVTGFKWLGGRKWYWLNVVMNGQANRRSTMMEAAQRVLNEAAERFDGFHACGYYQCD